MIERGEKGVGIKVGDILWCNDGRSHRRPWFESEIVGETRQSWICGYGGAYKINKKTMLENLGPYGSRGWYTAESKAQYQWLQMHPRQIARLVEVNKDIPTLLRVAALVGYVVEAPDPAALREEG